MGGGGGNVLEGKRKEEQGKESGHLAQGKFFFSFRLYAIQHCPKVINNPSILLEALLLFPQVTSMLQWEKT